MADVDPEFVEEGEEELEFKEEGDAPPPDPDESLPDEAKKLSKKEMYEKMREAERRASEAPDPTERITKAVTDAFGKVVAPTPVPVPVAGETEKEFRDRLKKDLFDEEKAEGVLNEVVDRRIGPRLAQVTDLAYRQAERLMELDPENGSVFRKYKGEVQEFLKKNFPVELQRNPQALELAFKQVYASHVQEIAEERARSILETERKKETLEPRRQPLPLESSPGPASTRKRIVTITQEDKRIADERGVDASVIAASRAARKS